MAAGTEPTPQPSAEGATGEAGKVEGQAQPAVTEGQKPEGAEPEGNGSLLPEGEAKPAEPAKPAAEPAKPEPIDPAKLTLPEGMKADDPGLVKLIATLGDDKLSPAQRIEALAGQHQELMAGVAKAAADHIHANYRSVNDDWIKQVEADPVIGGAKKSEALAAIAKAIDTWSPDAKATRQVLGLTGAGNNPAVLRTFHAMAMALAEGGPAQGALPQGKKSAAEIFYPTANNGQQ